MDFQRRLLFALVVLLFSCCVEGGNQLNSTTLLTRLEGSSLIVTPHIQFNNSHYYYNLSLVLIKERNPEGEIVQAVTRFNGSWSEPIISTNTQSSNYTHTAVRSDGEVNYQFQLFATVYQTTTDIPYGDLDALTFQAGDLSFGFKLANWPWLSPDNLITVRFRVTTYRDNGIVHGTELIWKDEIDPSGHVNGIVIINDASLRVHFPVTGISDGEKVYAGVGVDDIEYALELNFNFPHLSEYIYFCPSLGVTESRYEEYATVTLAVVLAIAAVILIAFFVYKWYHRRDPASVISA
eukprot:TRINITY_DN4304_c0_g1_i1.p1 TRINITY_DN4304_c0_g1~~TRINITY_DN4304_c0_g1_i1.p1  ORF type:complete len:294 (-),score=53.46 TRINITY_DN4304_c0_g1_i1:115-996(-)